MEKFYTDFETDFHQSEDLKSIIITKKHLFICCTVIKLYIYI